MNPGSLIVLPSAAPRLKWRNGMAYSHASIAMWPCVIVHGNTYTTRGATTKAGIEEALRHLGIEVPFMDTLTQGGVHCSYDDPKHGFLEYTGDMAYAVWPWRTIIEWLVYGWPRPSATDYDAPIGTWMWHDGGENREAPCHSDRMFPEFEHSERKQLLAAGVPESVVNADRLLTEHEGIDIAAFLLKKQPSPRSKNRTKNLKHLLT